MLVAYPMGEEVGRISAEGQELRMRTAVRGTDQRQWMLDNLAERFFIVIDEVEQGKLGLQILFHREVEQKVDRMLALVPGCFGYRSAFQMFVLVEADIVDESLVPFEHGH